MCGIFGFCGNKAPNMAKIKILGLYNKSRGRDSCGIFIDGKIKKGVNGQKEFDDFIEENILPTPKQNFTVIGHTRWSTRGANTEKNAHPYLINDRLVGAHNGTIQNIDDLCKKYGIDPKEHDVDSQALYHLLDQEGFGILNEYIGYAALAFTYPDDPHTLYLYHGASRSVKNGTLFEERPLFFMQTRDGIYFSSLEESLKAIRVSETEQVECLEYNTVLEIKNGKFTKNQWVIEREDNNIAATTTTRFTGNSNKASNNNGGKDTGNSSSNSSSSTKGAGTKSSTGVYEPIVLKETLPIRCLDKSSKNYVYYHQGRYWEHPRKVPTGKFHLMDRGFIAPIAGTNGSKPYYFFQGIMLKDQEAYNALVKLSEDNDSFLNKPSERNWAAMMSRYSKFPVTNNGREASNLSSYYKYCWYENEKRFNGSFSPKYSGRHYSMDNDGFLKDIKSSHKKDNTLFDEYGKSYMEIDAFTKGLLLDVPGGASEEEPFQGGTNSKVHISYPSPNYSPSPLISSEKGGSYGGTCNTNRLEGDPNCSCERPNYTRGEKRFYEKTYESYEAAMESLGDVEIEILRDYTRRYLTSINPLEPDDREVEIAVSDLITAAVKNEKSIEELCENEEDRLMLINAYKEFMDRKQMQDFVENLQFDESPFDATIEPNMEALTNAYIEHIDEIFEENENDKDMAALEIVNGTIDNLVQINSDAEDLGTDVDSDFAQEAAHALYLGLASLQGHLIECAKKHGKTDLVKRLKEINAKQATV